MRSKIVKYIFKKEMLDILRDKKTLFMMVILPIILYPIMMVAGSQIMIMSKNSMDSKELPIAIEQGIDAHLISMLKNYETNSKEQDGKFKIIEVDDYEKAINEEEIVAYIQGKDNEEYKIYTNSSTSDSYTATNRIEEVLNNYKEEKINKNLEEQGLNIKQTLEPISYETVDIAKNEEVAGNLLGQILPFILIIGILLGAIYPAIDVMAGEKERGTLETLLTLPISNLELVMGKYMAVSFSAIMSAIFNMLSILLTLLYLFASSSISMSEFGMASIDMSKLILPIIITLVCVCLFAMVISAISMCVCSLAKNFKDAQNYMTPIMLIVMLPSYVSMIPNMVLDEVTATIPVINISLLIKSVLSFKANFGLISLVLISNIVFVILSVVLLSKMFNSEEILFGSSSSFSFLEKRSNIKKGNMPTISDGVILYAVSLVLLIYVGSIIQVKLGMNGIALTQVMFIGITLLFAYYIKSDFKKVFSIKIPKVKDVLGGIILWAGGYILVMIITQVILHLFPQNMQVVEGLNEALYETSFLKNLLIVALMPAICEEVLFRGFIFKSFAKNNNYKMAIIGSAILFGFMHIDFLRIIPTSILGIVLAYSVYKSGSIFIAMLIHFINNSLAVFTLHYPTGAMKSLEESLSIYTPNLEISKVLILLVLSIALVIVGSKLLNNKNKKVNSIKNSI